MPLRRSSLGILRFATVGATFYALSACAAPQAVKPDPPKLQAADIPVQVCPEGVKTGGADFAILGKLRPGQDVSLELCVPADGHGKPAGTPCSNGKSPNSALPSCNDAGGHNPVSNPLKFKRVLNIPMLELDGSTCVMICSPPGTTLEGTSSCRLVCK